MHFVQFEKQQWHSILKNSFLLENNNFVIKQKSFQNVFMVGILYLESRKNLHCKLMAISFLRL